MTNKEYLDGFSMEEIDELASELFSMLAEEKVPIKLSILALCRAITMIGSDEDMDMACLMIDKIREMTAEEEYDIEDEVEDEDSEL